jgi:hypothetical protein
MADNTIVIPETSQNWGLYIEGSLCPFKSAAFTYGINFIPELRANIPYTEELEDLPDRTKIHLVYWDYTYYKTKNQMPRPCLMFAGEIRSPGQAQTASGSRSLTIEAKHFTDVLSELQMDFLGLGDYIYKKMTGESEDKYENPSGITGTIFEQFNISSLRAEAQKNPDFNKHFSEFGINSDITDLYDYVRLVFLKFGQLIQNNVLINTEYCSKKFFDYDFLDSIYYPDRKLKLPWSEMFNAILFQYYIGNIQKKSGEMTILQLISSMLQLFLFEMNINPMPKSFQYTLQPKPMNYFAPVPRCNMILPIYQPQYQFNPQWKSKITRLVQVTQPPNGIKLEAAFAEKYKNYAPKELSQKMALWHDFRGKNPSRNANESQQDFKALLRKSGFRVDSLVTQEELLRGKIEAVNVLPSYMTNVFEIVTSNSKDLIDKTKGVTASDQLLNGIGRRGEPNFSTDVGANRYVAPDEQRSRVLKYFHNYLSTELEKTSSYDSSLLNADKRSYIPKKIILVKKNSKFLKANGGINHVTYDVSGPNVKLKLPRYYHLYSEPIQGALPVIPYILKGNFTSKDLAPYVKNSTFNSGFYVRPNTDVIPVFDISLDDSNYVIKFNYSDQTKHLPTLNFAGGAFLSVIISFDDTLDASVNTVTEIIMCILGMTEMSVNDINDLSYFFSGLKSTQEIFPAELIKRIGQNANNRMIQISDQLRNNSKLDVKKAVFSIQRPDPATKTSTGEALPTNEQNIKRSSALNKPLATTVKTATSDKPSNKKTGVNIDLGETLKNAFTGGKNDLPANLNNNGFKNNIKTIKENFDLNQKTGDALAQAGTDLSTKFVDSSIRIAKSISTPENPVDPKAVLPFLLTKAASKGANKNNPIGLSDQAMKDSGLDTPEFKQLNTLQKMDAQSKVLSDLGSRVNESISGVDSALKTSGQNIKGNINGAGPKIAVLSALMSNGVSKGIEAIKSTVGKTVDSLKSKTKDAGKDAADKIKSDVTNMQSLLSGLPGLDDVQKTGILLSQLSAADASLMADAFQMVDAQKGAQLIAGNSYSKEINIQLSGFNPSAYYKMDALYTGYTQPMCEYFHIYNRSSSNNMSIPIVFNPYVAPGFPAFLIDNRSSDKPRHLMFYLAAVTHEITSDSVRTMLDCKLIRKFSEEVSGSFTKLGEDSKPGPPLPQQQNLLGDKVDSYREDKEYTKLFQEMEDIPFFGGEYSTAALPDDKDRFIIDETYQRMFGDGCVAVRESDIEKQKNTNNIRDAWEFNKREIQTLNVNFGNAFSGTKLTDLQSRNDKWFSTCPSKFGYNLEIDDVTVIPNRIYPVDLSGNEYKDHSAPVPFDFEIAALVDLHRYKIETITGLVGIRNG